MEELVTVFSDDVALPFVATSGESSSCFGGLAKVLRGTSSFGLDELHQIALISAKDLVSLQLVQESEDVPLLYGLRFDACLLRYRFAQGIAEVESVAPSKSADDWPYPNYPAVLPRVAMKVGSLRQGARAELAARLPQVRPPLPGECLIVVPPPKTLAYSLWGEGGDAAGTTLLFHCAWSSNTIVAENVCA